jgi:ribulose kinase
MADVMGRSIHPSAVADQSLVGAAIVAAAAAGIHPSVEAAVQAMQRWATPIEPDPAMYRPYAEVAARQRQVVERRRAVDDSGPGPGDPVGHQVRRMATMNPRCVSRDEDR